MVSTSAYILSSIGGILSILLSAAPLPKLLLAVRSKDFTEVHYIFLLMGHVGSTLWFFYAILAGIPEMVPNNFINFLITLGLNSVYLYYHGQLLSSSMIYVPSLLLLFVSSYLLDNPSVIGFTAAGLGIIQCSTLIAKVWEAIRSKDPKYLDLYINTAICLCSLTWLLYGIVTTNLIVIIPNVIGLSISVSIFIVYLWTKEVTAFCPCFSDFKTLEETPLTV
mmetsp:Transcript_10571/g.20356  ORF Transcript_10571/g.20356 Transcript_10571/m.20356 type:complete len:222 (+) Transcript_10571:944-1609(+)